MVTGNILAGSGMALGSFLGGVPAPTGVSDPSSNNTSAVFVTNIGTSAALTVDKGTSTGSGTVTSAPSALAATEMFAVFHSAHPSWPATWDRMGRVHQFDGYLPVSLHVGKLDGGARRRRKTKAKRPRLRVALDCVGGAGAIAAPDFLREICNCNVRVSGPYSDGVFTHAPEPTAENLKGFCRFSRRVKAAVGFAQDPDADRLAIIDERGVYIGEEYTLALAAESLLFGMRPSSSKGREPTIVTNLSTSRMLDDIAAAHGARVVRTPVGEANVVEAMKREKAAGHEVVLGGEGNGGVIWPRVTYVRDSLSAMALVLALMARTGKKVSELVASIPAYAIEKRKVDLARKEDARPAIEKLAAAYRGGDRTIDLQDGIRIDWPARRAWLHVRASNTEPIMRLIAEAPTATESRAILDEAARVIAG